MRDFKRAKVSTGTWLESTWRIDPSARYFLPGMNDGRRARNSPRPNEITRGRLPDAPAGRIGARGRHRRPSKTAFSRRPFKLNPSSDFDAVRCTCSVSSNATETARARVRETRQNVSLFLFRWRTFAQPLKVLKGPPRKRADGQQSLECDVRFRQRANLAAA